MPETIEKTAKNFNTFVGNATPEQLTAHIQQCMEAFCRTQVPTAEMVNEVVLLSLAMSNKHQFLLIVNSYLQKLNQLEVKAGYHLSGYARILIHSLEAHDQIGLNKGLLLQVCCSFINLWSGVCLKNQEYSDIDEGLLSLSQLLVVLERSKTVLPPRWLSKQGDEEKGLLNILVDAYKQTINRRSYGKEAQAWFLALTGQIMTRLTAQSKKDALIDSGTHLGNAAECVLSAMGSGLSGAGTPFFIGTVGAIPGLVKGLINLGQALVPLAKCAKTKFDKKAWYPQLTSLQEALLLSTWHTMQTSADEITEPPLLDVLVTLFGNDDFWKCWQIQSGACDTLETILRGTLYPSDGIEGLSSVQTANVQQIVLASLVHIFRQSKDMRVRALVLRQLVALQTADARLSKVLSNAFEQILQSGDIDLVALAQEDKSFESKGPSLMLELEEGEESMVTPYLAQLALRQGRETSALLAQQLTPFVEHKRKRKDRSLPLLVTQVLLHILEQHDNINIEITLEAALAENYSGYLKDGKVYSSNPQLIEWLEKTWLAVSLQPFDEDQAPVNRSILPLWSLCASKTTGKSFDEYIKNRYTLVRVGKNSILTDAKTEKLMALSGQLARTMRELNRDIPPSAGTRTRVEHDYIATDIVDGGAVHITGDDFFIKAAEGLSALVKALAPDEEMQEVLEEPIGPAKDLQSVSTSTEGRSSVGKMPVTFFGKSSTKNSTEEDSLEIPALPLASAGLGKQ